jgi:predicted CXXCH cytochrome family protein
LNAGQIKKENCLACHDRAKALKEDRNKKLMHQKHVTIKNARCLDCHQPILHTKADLDQPVMAAYAGSDMSQPKLPGCAACHSEPHRYQRLLSAGPKRPGVSRTPDFMFKARTNCLGCHIEKESNAKGQIIMKASAKTCVRCHTKDHKKMLQEWKTELTDEVKYSQEIEQEALAAFAKAKLTEPRLAEARKMLSNGRENLNIVKFGNGVHNKKYSIMLIDAAITHFEDMIEYLEEGE